MAAKNTPGGGVPVPLPDADNRLFWEGCKAHELRIQRCKGCGAHIHYPRPACNVCQGMEFDYVVASGRAHVYSFIIAHQAFHPAFKDKTPYNVVVVELDDLKGVRMASTLLDVESEEIEIGTAVEVVWEDVDDEISLYKFKRLS